MANFCWAVKAVSLTEQMENIKGLVQSYYKALNEGTLDRFEAYVSADFMHHTPGVPAGWNAFKQVLMLNRQGFANMTSTVEALIAEGDQVVARTTTRGTHTGSFFGHPPSGKSFTVTGMDMFRVVNGQLAEQWSVFDTVTLLQQLGLYASVNERGH